MLTLEVRTQSEVSSKPWIFNLSSGDYVRETHVANRADASCFAARAMLCSL